MPGRYRLDARAWRPRHIHYRVSATGCAALVTQLYFRGEAGNDSDPFIRPSLTIELDERQTPRGVWRQGTFDIVLAPA